MWLSTGEHYCQRVLDKDEMKISLNKAMCVLDQDAYDNMKKVV